MALEIAELGDGPDGHKYAQNYSIVGVPIGEEVQLDGIQECKEDPVVDGVDEDPLEGHGDPAEHMHEGSLILPLHVMQDGHHQGKCLYLVVLFLVAEQVEDGEDDDGPCILDVEHVVPFYLWAQVLHR